MERKKPSIPPLELTELTYTDKLDHYMMIRHHVTKDELIQLPCLTRFRHTFQTELPEPKKD